MLVRLIDAARRSGRRTARGLLVSVLATGCGSSPAAPDPEARACSIWVYGVRNSPSGQDESRLLRSRDAGRSWVVSRNPVPRPIVRGLGAFYFSSPDNGWITTNMALYRTFDGGDSWARVLSLGDQAVPGIDDTFS